MLEFAFGTTTIRITTPTRDALFSEISRRWAAGEGFALATLNLDHLAKLSGSERFRAAYAAQDLVVADGNPVVWLSRLAGKDVDLLPGADLVAPLAQRAAAAGVRVALVGTTTPALAAAAAHLRRVAPGVEIIAEVAPPMGFEPDGPGADAVFEALGESGARLVFVALGAPKQELLAALGRARLPSVGFASIGAGLDFLAGAQRRAPAWVRALALEWLWRMAGDPLRLAPRYARCAAILPGQVVAALRQRG